MTQIKYPFHSIDKMCLQGLKMSKDTALQLIQDCMKTKDISLIRHIHSLLVENQLDSMSILGDHLIRIFAECGSLHEASLVFCAIAQPSNYTWQAIVAAHSNSGEYDCAFRMYEKMVFEGIRPDKFIFMSVLKACSIKQDLTQAEFIHNQIVENGVALDVMMGSTLVDMYAKCGNLEMACEVFHKMQSRDTVTWNSMIGAYVHHGNGILALELYNKMQSEGIDPDRVTFLNALKACGLTRSLDQGKALHDRISSCGLATDVVIGSTLIDMYAKCGSMEEAHKIFDNLPNRNVVSWGAMISGYTQNGHGFKALELFSKMREECVKPDKVILASLLKAAGNLHAMGHGDMLYEQVIRYGLEKDLVVGNNLFYMYAKSGSLEEARKVFDRLPNRDVVSWATMISGYVQHGQGLSALNLFTDMQQQGISPDEVAYSCVLKACSTIGAFGQGKLIHDRCSRESESDVVLANTLIDMYAKCGNVHAAQKLFDTLPERNVISWNSIITAYVHDGQGHHALKLYEEMQQEGIKPTKVTFLGALKACSMTGDFDFVKLLHGQLKNNGLVSDLTIKNALLDAYAKCYRLDLAFEVFNSAPTPDVVSWGAMIGGYVHNGQNHAAIQVFNRMQQQGIKPDNITIASILKACSSTGALEQGKVLYSFATECGAIGDILVSNAVVDMFSKCGNIGKAREVFDHMSKRDVVSWNSMIGGYTLHGDASMALELYEDMQRHDFKPDEVTFLSVLKACSTIASAQQGRYVHDEIIKSKHALNLSIGNSLIDMYTKCGHLREAQCVFDSVPSRNVISWGVIIEGYAQHGMLCLAKKHLQEMNRQGLKPDSPIHLSILAACSHMGLAEEGYNHFKSMEKDYGTIPCIEHFNCLVDLLGRAGRLSEAVELLQTIPELPTLPAWVSLLTACKSYGNRELAKCCFTEVCRLDPENASGYALMLDISVNSDSQKDLDEIVAATSVVMG